MNPDLRLALALADQSDEITMKWFQSSALEVRTKSDKTPVSAADEEVERMIRATLQRERPGDGIVGEEFGVTGDASRRWIIDPIDATKNYIRGIPVFATLLALEENGRIVAGVVSAPALARRWWASAGAGAFRNGRAIHVSGVASIDEAHLAYDSVSSFDPFGTAALFLALARRCARTRAFGDFWSHMLVAEGAMEIAIEPQVEPWDMAPVQIIVEEAGGRFTDLRGNARHDGGSGVSTNGALHDEVLELFGGNAAGVPEQVMVVAREDIAAFLVERGLLRERTDEILDAINERHFFIDRPTAEVSPQYKQIIPYVVVRHGDSFYLLQRTPRQTEARLHHKLSIGVGGHINPDTPELLDGLRKELEEEVDVAGDYDLTFAGILNDDTTDVGRVHLGAVFVLDTHDGDVRVRETEKMSGRWAARDELARLRDQMESWSEIVYDEFVAR